jgi:nitrate reductase delta subunit
MKTLRILSALLTYPTKEMMESIDKLVPLMKEETWMPKKELTKIEGLVEYLKSKDLLDLQEEYVALFDRTPSLSLHMFEHIHGESAERGQAMVDLAAMYDEIGLEIASNETPDYLPLFLEYLSQLHGEEAQQCLGEVVNVIAAVGKRLEKRKSKYTALFNAMRALTTAIPDEKFLKKALAMDDGHALSMDETDDAWEEQMAFDGLTPKSEGCGTGCSSGGCGGSMPPKEKLKVVVKEGEQSNA